ncbi:hypothetical protein [Alteromonas sp. a30]|uniref:hypothetical protein n=1 Tax=Alteromonas sp. a30 TaxID=2730917 RepID=UPI0022828E59|nr:hypothetical protein [Alteromonas sp. a30]MCY7296649.1 hypothetical protein [Alteromonas sp. a30]
MKCPHCGTSIQLFSKALNKWGRVKSCPSCEKKVKLAPSLKWLLILFIPIVASHVFLLKPYILALGIDGGSFAFLWYVSLMLLTLRLDNAEDEGFIYSKF